MLVFGTFCFKSTHKSESIILHAKNKVKNYKNAFDNKYLKVICGEKSANDEKYEIFKIGNNLCIGKIFRKSDYQKPSREELGHNINYSFDEFTEKYWGSYIFFKFDEKNKVLAVLRDPIGQFPFFYKKLPDNQLVFSSKIDLIHQCLQEKLSFNIEYFSSYLRHSFITSQLTPFESIFELPHGCTLRTDLKSTPEISVAWNPLKYANAPYKGEEETKKDLLSNLSEVIKSWTENTNSLSIHLSGGLDSSSILFLLNSVLTPDQNLKAINFFNEKVQSSDERKYARCAADQVGIELLEYDDSNTLDFDPVFQPPNFKPNWPTPGLNSLRTQYEVRNLNYTPGCHNLHISGHGGDHVFLTDPPQSSLLDYLTTKGTKNFGKKLTEIAVLYRQPFPVILSNICKTFLLYHFSSENRYNSNETNMSEKVPWFKNSLYDLSKRVSPHPFFMEKRKISTLPGKCALIDIIYQGLASIKEDIMGSSNPIFYPLLSQPIIELALAIPTYESYSKDYSRYLFRKAISEKFSTNSVWRRDKGEISGTIKNSIRKNKKYIQELCLDGFIAQSGLIDRARLEVNINELASGNMEYQWPFSNLFSCETFINYWRSASY